jgi:hypothetical protein
LDVDVVDSGVEVGAFKRIDRCDFRVLKLPLLLLTAVLYGDVEPFNQAVAKNRLTPTRRSTASHSAILCLHTAPSARNIDGRLGCERMI